MRKICLIVALFILCIQGYGQKSELFLALFPDNDSNTIINTSDNLDDYFKRLRTHTFPDTIALKYFFDGDVSKMEGVFESYNMDENKYSYTKYKKKSCPIFKQSFDNLFLLYYGIESELYLALYNPEIDEIITRVLVSEFSDEFGNVYTHSTIFINGYIVTTSVNKKIKYSLKLIDVRSVSFKEIKLIEVDNLGMSDKEILSRSFFEVGIAEDGKIIENQLEKSGVR